MKNALLFLTTLILFSFTSKGQTLYVDSAAALGGNGATWATAYTELSDALDSAWHNPMIAEIHVAKGTYHPSSRPYEMDSLKIGSEYFVGPDENVTFHIRTGIELLGGFPSGGGLRDILLNETILDGFMPNGDTVYRVCYIDSSENWATPNDTTSIDGFSIRNGSIRDNYLSYVNNVLFATLNAGGISVYGGRFVISNNTISGNNSAISIYNASGIIHNNIIKDNDSLMGIGTLFAGIGLGYCTVVIEENDISYNRGRFHGGIYSTLIKSIVIRKNVIHNNYGLYNGGGVIFSNFMEFEENIVFDNSGGRGGMNFSTGRIHNNLFMNNSGANIGAVHMHGTGIFTNNVLYNNSGADVGGLYAELSGNLLVGNNTFVSNSNLALRICCGTPEFSNNIFYNNANDFEWNSNVDSNSYIFRNNLLQDDSVQYTITNYKPFDSLDIDNLYNLNPLFVDINNPLGPDNIFGTADDGLQLLGNSPCIDSGNNSLIPAGVTTDVTGVARIQNGIVNIGAYESVGWVTSTSVVSLAPIDVLVYPNPCHDYLSIRVTEDLSLVIEDILGKKHIAKNIFSGTDFIDVSSLVSGLYFLQFSNGKASHTQKLLRR